MATQLLTDAEMRLELGETPTWQSPDIPTRLLAQQSRTRVEDTLRTAEAETREALARHRDDLERIAKALIDTRKLHAEDLANLLDQVIPNRTRRAQAFLMPMNSPNKRPGHDPQSRTRHPPTRRAPDTGPEPPRQGRRPWARTI
ncbi:hypothetical protein [Roseovarius sp. SYSU LYC5161]|uniref:hypothetical protein n=1 Tax=Roseovarius halophilus (ex Wu et al. 2025) TaxID=3376060 RepID=UPI00399B87EA